MVDIYVAAILTALAAAFKSLATIRAGPGAIAFGAARPTMFRKRRRRPAP